MNKKILFSLFLLLFILGAEAQVELRTSDLLRIGMEPSCAATPPGLRAATQSDSRNVEMIIRYDNDQTLKEIEESGGRILNLVGRRTAIVSAPSTKLRNVAACKGVRGAMLSTLLKHANNKAIPASGVDAVRSGIELPKGFDGDGVILGLFDVGISPNHINFLDAEGNSRVSMVWDYKGSSAVPTVYDTPEKIAAFDGDRNSDTHGTHVLGIMSGSFVDTSKSDAPDYRGVAPGSEIVVASGEGYSVQLLDAVERIGAYAQSKGKPCVINLSFGDNVGPHDGTDEFTEAINDVAAKYNAAICLAGGNEGSLPISIVKTLSEQDTTLKTLLIKNTNDFGSTFQVYGPVEIWTNDDTPFEVVLDIVTPSSPNKPVYSFTVPVEKETYVVQGSNLSDYLGNTDDMDLIKEGTAFQDLYVNSFMGGISGIDSHNGCYFSRLNFYIQGRNASNAKLYLVKITVKGKAGRKIYIYTDGFYMEFGNKNIEGIDLSDGFGTNSNMACGKETFAVGSYVTANIPGSGYPSGIIGDISYFSSYGETLDGRVMPDITAPGQVIISSRNVLLPTTPSYAAYYPLEYSYTDPKTDKTYYWTSCAGTSQASPHVAGVMALVREANPDLTYKEVYDVIRQTAQAVDDDKKVWGYGKLDAHAAVKAALSLSGINSLADRGIESFMLRYVGNNIEISSLLEDNYTVSVYNASGMCIRTIESMERDLILDTSAVDPGLYIVRIKGKRNEKTVKVML